MFETRADYAKGVITSIFQLSNKLQSVLDRQLQEDGITAKQFFLMLTVDRFEDYSPTFTDIGRELGSSRQNVKQLALKLQENDYVSIYVDPLDTRSKRVSLTDRAKEYIGNNSIGRMPGITDLFSEVTTASLRDTYHGMNEITEEVLLKEK